MWGQGFNGKLFGFISLDWFGGTMTHPLFSAAGRKYMVLAAMRLAMLIKIIRKRYPDDTINVVGHSQGTLLTLLAHAFLKDDGVEPADGVIMLNSPYGLFEPLNEAPGLEQPADQRGAAGHAQRYPRVHLRPTPSGPRAEQRRVAQLPRLRRDRRPRLGGWPGLPDDHRRGTAQLR